MAPAAIRTLLLGSALVLLPATRALAWGPAGHEVVCRIAVLLLEPTERQELDGLMRRYQDPDGQRFRAFVDSCAFADRARAKARARETGWDDFKRFDDWHFLNVPRGTRTVAQSHCGTGCVLIGITSHSATFANRSAPPQSRALAAALLAHWVADVHQPLHVSYADDRGGSEVPVAPGFYGQDNLHAVWDSGILQRAMGATRPEAYAQRLGNRITPTQRTEWRAGMPIDWAQESYALTTMNEADYCEWSATAGGTCRRELQSRPLAVAYQRMFEDDVERRLQQAGSRLADRIRSGLRLR